MGVVMVFSVQRKGAEVASVKASAEVHGIGWAHLVGTKVPSVHSGPVPGIRVSKVLPKEGRSVVSIRGGGCRCARVQ